MGSGEPHDNDIEFIQTKAMAMNLFGEIEGRRGENLSSALLRFILMRSQDARTKLAELITGLVGESFEAMHRFACSLETGTTDDIHGPGRIDLLLEMDNGLVGIENKFNAGFQNGQPQKYLDALSLIAEKSAKGGAITSNRYILLILAPAQREGEIKKKIAELSKHQQEHCKFLSWEEMLRALNDVLPTQDSKTKEVILDFSAYVNRYLNQSFFRQNRSWLESLRHWKPYGSERQQSVTSDLWEFFPGARSRPSQGDKWRGYYFTGGWFGFVEKTAISTIGEAEPRLHEAEFVIVVSFDPVSKPDPTIFHRISMVHSGFSGAPEKAAYRVDFGELTSREKLTDALRPFFNRSAETGLVDGLDC